MKENELVTIDAELSLSRVSPPVPVPVISEDAMPVFQREWRRNGRLRTLIRAAGKLTEEEVAGSQVLRGLWEMAQSREWRVEDGRGLCIEYPEFRIFA